MIDLYRDILNKILDEQLKQNEQLVFTQKVADGTLNIIDEMKKMQEFLDDNTEVLFCSPSMKKKICDLSIPMCEVIASPAIPDTEVYMVTDDAIKKDLLKTIRGIDDATWFNRNAV